MIQSKLIRSAIATLLVVEMHSTMVAAAPPTTPDPEPSSLRVAGIVLKWLKCDKEENFQRAVPMIREAAQGGAKLVCTTECFLDGYAIEDKSIPDHELRKLGEVIPGGEYFEKLRALADELDIYLVAGMLERDGGDLYNTAVTISPEGRLVAKYHKQKLGHEQPSITAGVESSLAETGLGQLGVMICADRTEREIVDRYCAKGAEFLVCPSGGMAGPNRNDPIVQSRSRENSKHIVFVHPAEFLVTAPDGTVARRVLVGDRRTIDPHDVGTVRDTGGVFYHEVPRPASTVESQTVKTALQKKLLDKGALWEQLRTSVDSLVPTVETPSSREEWESRAENLRNRFLDEVVFRGEAAKWRDAETRVRWFETVDTGDDYVIRKFAYEALPGFWIPGLLYEPKGLTGIAPVVINVNGHDHNGKTIPYKQRRCINLAKRGMLAFNLEFIDMGQLRDRRGDRGNKHNRLVQLDLCGTSGVAPFFLTLTRGLDVALDHPRADHSRVAVAGLSGGGWQSIWLASLDPRITVANPVAGYCGIKTRTARRNDIGDAEQIPSDMCTVADYTCLTALVAPRPLLLTYNAKDNCCFLPPEVLPALEASARPVYSLYGREDDFFTHVNHDPGTHNFDRDNREAFYRLLGHAFHPDNANYSSQDIPTSDEEILTADDLSVPLPSQNPKLHDLAVQLSHDLPLSKSIPLESETAAAWQREMRATLAKTIRLEQYEPRAEKVESLSSDSLQVNHWRLKLGDKWTLPATEFTGRQDKSTVIVIGDDGRSSLAGLISTELKEGNRVLAIDLLGFGEASPRMDDGREDDICLHLAATVGRRPLGIMAGQLATASSWLRETDPSRPVKVIAVGPRSTAIALASAATNKEPFDVIELHHCLPSLKELIWENWILEEAPELFCFGLLKVADLSQMAALAAPASITVHDPRTKLLWEWRELPEWFQSHGRELRFETPTSTADSSQSARVDRPSNLNKSSYSAILP